MQDIDARREARRQRILNNLDSRLDKITGKCNKSSSKGSPNDNANTAKLVERSQCTTDEKTPTSAERVIPKENEPSALLHDSYIESATQFERRTPLSFDNLLEEDTAKPNDDSNFKSLFSLAYLNQSQYLLLSPVLYIFLAAFVNILFIVNVNLNLYKGIVTPFIILAITQLSLGYKFKQFQGSNILVATLILCNIKPEIVHNFKWILMFCNTFFKNLSLYLTTFILCNWITSIWCPNNNQIQFL